MTRIKRLLLSAAALLFVFSVAWALEVPYLSGRINDTANMLSSGVVVELEEMLKAYEDSTTNQIVLLTIPSLEGESLEDYSLRVAETWKLGQKGVDNGVLLLIARDDRKLRIEVGYGLEASVTDAISTMIINGIITPRFKQGDFEGGIREGLIALTKAADGTLSEAELATSSDEEFPLIFFLLFWYGIVGVFTFIALFVAQLGTQVVAGHRVVANLAGICYMLPLSLALATLPCVGQAAGARDWRSARVSALAGVCVAGLVSTAFGAALWCGRTALVDAYTDDPVVRGVGLSLIAYLAAYQVFDAVQTVAAHALRGYKITFLPMLVHVAAFWGVGLAGGWWLAFRAPRPMGAAGFWLASLLSLVFAAVFLGWLLWRVARAQRR